MGIVLSLDGEGWLLATDPENVGRDQKWCDAPRPDAVPTRVPWIIQDPFPGYHGVAWYWRDFVAPKNPHPGGRYLLRFWMVDYKADVWLNGTHAGTHEGGESAFVLDVTGAVRPGENRLAVRVLNPTHEPIDGIVLNETPHRNKAIPYTPGSDYDHGGIVDSVELIAAPAVRISDLFLRPDMKSGEIRVQATIVNAGEKTAGRLELAAAPAASGETLAATTVERDLPPGETVLDANLHIDSPRLWNLSDPYLYRVTARVAAEGTTSADEMSARCGFREFRFENGYFRLNGKRVFLRCSHTGNCCPVGQVLPLDPDWLRRDLLNVKVMGFNAIRWIAGVAWRHQLDLCDEIGLMVYEEPYAAWCLADSPKMAERYDESFEGMIRRDRNHPSVVIWGLLNETADGPVFQHAVAYLPRLRELDDTRLVMLDSGRFDCRIDVGSLANPGSAEWEFVLGDEAPGAPKTQFAEWAYCTGVGDAHIYPPVPHTAEVIRMLRTVGGDKHILVTEYGIGSAVNLSRVVRWYEQLGKADAEDGRLYRGFLDQFLADWERWRMDEGFASPDDYFARTVERMAGERLRGLNALRANPNLVGHSLTGTVDQGWTGEGLFTTFRELKRGTADAIFEGFAPLRLCLFAEPVNLWRGGTVRLEAVLADEDVLRPGEYPLRLQVVGPNNERALDRRVTVTIPERAGTEPPFAMPVYAEDAVIDAPAGRYRFLATFERGAAAAGGETEFYLGDPADLPRVEGEIVLWGEDAELAKWLADRGVRTRAFDAESEGREVILVGVAAPTSDAAEAWRALATHIARGSTAVFLAPEVFARADDPLGWLPLENKGTLAAMGSWLYLWDEWAKPHPIFDGLPAGIMDYTFYREIIGNGVWVGQDPPAEAVAGAIKASQGYQSGLLVAVYDMGAGRMVLNTLLVRENLGKHPAADRLLVNMLRYAAR
jgi:hypothetical protein